jgi:hypothetical protein
MKLSPVILFLSLFASTLSVAGMMDSTPAQRASVQTEFMTERLKLTPDLATKVQALNLKYADKMEPVLKGSDNMLAKRQKANALMEAKDKELSVLLTKEQFELYEDAKDDLKETMEKKLGK